MPTQETMDKIETNLTRVEDTVDTLERIPNVNLNGTTKQQQVLILSTVAGLSLISGVILTYSVMKTKLRLRKKTETPPLPIDLSSN